MKTTTVETSDALIQILSTKALETLELPHVMLGLVVIVTMLCLTVILCRNRNPSHFVIIQTPTAQ